MRLGIDYRLLASRENLVERGIGRYTQQQLRHVLRLDAENEYVLLCPSGADVSSVLGEIRAAPNVSLRFAPPGVDPPPHDPYERRGALRRSAEYQDWIHGLGIDLYHATAPFVLEQTAPPTFDACPMVCTVYDLIPLIFPSAYLPDSGRRAAYAGAARLVSGAGRLIAISEATRDDVGAYLGFPVDRVDCASPFADRCFRPLTREIVGGRLSRLDREGLPERFVLTVAALHHSKNLELLLGAYGRLSASFRRSLPLVVACYLNKGSRSHLQAWAGSFGVADDLVLTGYVSDAELAALYNRATLVAHPSRNEGFGLPVVEAMQCGAAVVTTTAASLREVTGEAAVLVDPDDPIGLAAAIEGLSKDDDRRRWMGEAGRARSAAFTPEALARNTLESYRRALSYPRDEGSLPHLALVCSFPGAAVEAADHAGLLLRILTHAGDVDVFTDDGDGPLPDELLDRGPVHHLSAFDRAQAARPFDAVVVVDSDGERARLVQVHPASTVVVEDTKFPTEDLAGRLAGVGRRPHATAASVGFNKLCEVEDFDDPELRKLFDGTDGGTLGWSVAMSLRALAELGVRPGGARVLCVGFDAAQVAFRLAGHVREVTLAAPWLDDGAPPHARAMLVDPALVSGEPVDPGRFIVRHADIRRLPFPPATFDAVVSCRAVDRLAGDDFSLALAETARVVTPSGLVALSTTVRLHGPRDSPGIPIDWVRDHLLPESDLVMVDGLRDEVSKATLTGRRRLASAVDPAAGVDGERPLAVSQGAVLGCLHLTLRTQRCQGSV